MHFSRFFDAMGTVSLILWATPSAAGPRSLPIASGLQILGIVASASWHLRYANLSFGMIGSFTLACWGTLGQFWDIGGHKEGPCEVQAWILSIFLWFRGPIWKFFGYFWIKNKIFFWWFLGLNLGVWDWKNMHLAWKVLQKITFTEIGFLVIPGLIFYDFWWLWDQFSCFLLPLKLAWNLMSFHGDSGIPPDPGNPAGGG